MGGGLLQLVAYGAQDVYLTGNPQITFFKVVYRRHTNFAIEAIEQTFNGTAGYGQRVTCQISRNGDLIHRVYLQVDLGSANTDYLCKFFGLRLINYVELEIGGQRIDKHYSHWLYIWNELSLPLSKRMGYNDMVGAYGGRVYTGSAAETVNPINRFLYIPLEFWFCRNVGLALPLIALQYHEVKININFETASKCAATLFTANATPATAGTFVNASDPSKSFTASLWVDYIFLDTDERRRFAQLSHEYLIEQLQFTGQEAITTSSIKPKLNFNHPVKELIWIVTNNNADNNNWMNYTITANDTPTATNVMAKRLVMADNTSGANATYPTYTDNNYYRMKDKLQPMTNSLLNHVYSAKLSLNGNDRFSQRQGSYFNLIQTYQHHENVPTNAGINVYSFALKPEEHQPSGTLNMSRIDSAVLTLNLTHDVTSSVVPTINYSTTPHSLYVFAVNYNVLRILSGMGGLAYSN